MLECVDKAKVRDFFDRLAPKWDDQLIVWPEKMERILDAACIGEGANVLDVACGTGVMVDFYLQRGVSHVTGIDFSTNMAGLCRRKYADEPRVDVVCADAELHEYGHMYDAVMVFNAFPHFPKPRVLIEHLETYVEPGGTLTVAHDMGRKRLDDHHSGVASSVSHGMLHEDDVAALFDSQFSVDVKLSEPDIFIVSATRVQPASPGAACQVRR